MKETTKSKHSKKPRALKVQSPFRDWVSELGQGSAALRIGCSDRALRAWLEGEYFPKIGFLKRIVKLSQGRLTEKIILDHVNAAAEMLQSESYS